MYQEVLVDEEELWTKKCCNVTPRLSSQQPQAALKQEARRDSLKLGSRRLPLKLGCKAAVETKVAQRPRPRNITHRGGSGVQNSSFNISQTVAKC